MRCRNEKPLFSCDCLVFISGSSHPVTLHNTLLWWFSLSQDSSTPKTVAVTFSDDGTVFTFIKALESSYPSFRVLFCLEYVVMDTDLFNSYESTHKLRKITLENRQILL